MVVAPLKIFLWHPIGEDKHPVKAKAVDDGLSRPDSLRRLTDAGQFGEGIDDCVGAFMQHHLVGDQGHRHRGPPDGRRNTGRSDQHFF